MSGLFSTVFADAPRLTFDVGDPVFLRGDPVVSMYLLLRGRVILVRHTVQGARMILHRAEPGEVVAEASAWSDNYHCGAVAAETSEVAFLSRPDFRTRLATAPGLAKEWAKNLARAVQKARLRAEIRSLPTVADRLDAWLGEGNMLPERGRLQDVAAELGVTRETFYRELSRRRAS